MMTAGPFVDSHCHLHERGLATDIGHIVDNARRAGVQRMFCNATREQDWQAVCELATAWPGIIPFLGIHPWFAETAEDGWDSRLQVLLERTPVGIGETGLDRVCQADFTRQTQVFRTQLAMASISHRPLVIHCVKAWGNLLEILEQHARTQSLPPTMIHSFSGSEETLHRLLALGCLISFSCALLANGKLHSRLQKTPATHLLLETDAPPHKPTRPCHEPAAITRLYHMAATVRETTINEFSRQIWKNAAIFTDTILPR